MPTNQILLIRQMKTKPNIANQKARNAGEAKTH
jgi:hypothetical protein